MPRKVALSEQEQEIVDAARTKPVWGLAQFTDFFCRADDTGTRFSVNEDEYMYTSSTRYDDKGTLLPGVTMYEYLNEKWERDGRPERLVADGPAWAQYYIGGPNAPYSSVVYSITVENESPVFFWHHGWIPLEWGARMHYAKQPNACLLGGYGSSKTAHVGMSAFTWCACCDRFRFICIASYQQQALPMYHEILNVVLDTPAEKFIARSRSGQLSYSERPNPNIRFANGSSMLFLGADKDLGKVLSETADWVAVEQAESHSSIEEIKRQLGSRRRGRVRNRQRLGRMTLIANAGEAPELWDYFELADTQPGRYFSYALSSYDNPHLSKADIENLELDVCGGDQDEINQHMRGFKPAGKYKDFPREVVLGCQSAELDGFLKIAIATGTPGADEKNEPGIGHSLWTLPYQEGRDYAVYGDPGTGNPPRRGAGVVLVVDETGFPFRPADIVHFEWVFGNGMIGPWINAFEDAIRKYHAQGRAYFESTGDQKNMNETVFQDRGLIVEGILLGGGLKHGMKIKLLRILERKLIRFGKSISPIRTQLAKYDEQKDKVSSHLPQDIVTVLMIIASRLGDLMIEPGKIDRDGGVVRRAVRGSGGYRRISRVSHRARRGT